MKAVSVPPPALRFLRGLAIAAAVAMVLLFVWSALRRMHFPYDLEWVEDGNLQELQRMMRHQPLYVPPTVDYVPYLYAPLFYVFSALAAKGMGVSFAAMRMVSFVSALGVFAGIFALVYQEFPEDLSQNREGNRRAPRLLAASVAVGFFACAYPVTNSFFDFGRVDMLCLCFSIFALLAGRKGHAVVAALLWTAAFETKQGVLPVALLALCFEWRMPRRILLGLGTFALAAGGSVLYLNHQSGGWFGRYAFGMAGGFPLLPRQIFLFLPLVVLTPFAIALLLGVAALLLTPPDWRSRKASFYACSGLGMLLFTWYIFAHLGASSNSVLPAFVYIAVAGGLGLGRLLGRLEASDAPWASAASAILLGAAIVQIAMHAYTPNVWEPTLDQKADLDETIGMLRKVPGDVLVMDHAEYAMMAGHKEFANGEAAIAMILVKNGAVSDGLHEEYARLIHEQKLGALALDTNADRSLFTRTWIPADFERYYPVRVNISKAGTAFMTPHPTVMYMPCPSASRPDAAKLFPGSFVDESACSAR